MAKLLTLTKNGLQQLLPSRENSGVELLFAYRLVENPPISGKMPWACLDPGWEAIGSLTVFRLKSGFTIPNQIPAAGTAF
ncbi:MAG: hypothetical protein NTAFB09_15410 [Nitrosospira sp.]